MKGSNLVLYAVRDGTRQPLVSVAPKDAFAVTKIQHAASAELHRCDTAGAPHSPLKCVLETRESGEDGRQLFARFVEVDPVSLKPRVEGDKGVSEIDALFKETA